MSIKFKVDIDLSPGDLLEGVKGKLNAANSAVAGTIAEKARATASHKLRAGLKWWEQGFKVDSAGDGVWVLSVSGKLATMMEDGFGPGAISDLILKGNRYKHNRAMGKDYVDVPIPLNVNNQTQAIQGTKVRVQQFTNIQELQKQFTFSDYKKGGVKAENRVIKRIDDIIKSRKKEEKTSQFLTIRRLTPNQQWPKNPFAGSRALEPLDQDIEVAFSEALKNLFK